MSSVADAPVTQEELVARAVALHERVLEEAPETEERRYYSQELHEEFERAGFYRMFIPRRFGGLEADVTTYVRVVMALAQADMGTAWCMALAAAHALQIGTLFGERAQEEIFGDGDFRCASVGAPAGTAKRTDDGWEITGKWAYSSGAPYSTHYLGHTMLEGEGDGPPSLLLFVAPRSQWRMENDWGQQLGLKGSGSHSITLEGARIPEHWGLENTSMIDYDVSDGTPGYRLHGNHLYAGRTATVFSLEMAALGVGAAKGGLEEVKRSNLSRRTAMPPIGLRADDPDYQRWFGSAIARLGAAEFTTLSVANEWMEHARRNVEESVPFEPEADLRLGSIGREAVCMAWDVVQSEIAIAMGSSAMRDGERMQRLFRDMTMLHTHFFTVAGDTAHRRLGQQALGRVSAPMTPLPK